MKLIKLIKSVIVPILVFSYCSAQAKQSSQVIPYYGEDFYRDLNVGTANEALKARLKQILRNFHVAIPGQNDLIVKTCQAGQQGACYSHRAITYGAARMVIMGSLHLVRSPATGEYAVQDVYCGKPRTQGDFRKSPPAPGVVPDNRVINVEHTWPQSRFTGRFRDDVQKSDLHHLFPTDTEINAIRGNNLFGEVTKDLINLKCPEARFGLGSAGSDEVFEPPREHKGNVARALFYFSTRYDLPIDEREETILRKWNHEDPVDADEFNRNNEIFKVQGNRNPFVDFSELPEKIENF